MVDSSITHTVTAFFDDRATASVAMQRLVDMDIPLSAITLSGGHDADDDAPGTKSWWEKLEDFFLPDDDRHLYSEGLRRGGYLVTVSGLTVEKQLAAAEILDHDGSVDLADRSGAWQSEGWSPSPTGLVSDTSDYGNRAFDQSSGRFESSEPQEASPSGRAQRTLEGTPLIEVPIVAEAFGIAKKEHTDRRRVRVYTVEKSDVPEPDHPNPGSTTLV